MQRKLEAILAKDVEMKQMAQRAFVTYIKSVYLMKDKEVFDVNKIDLEAFARYVAPFVANYFLCLVCNFRVNLVLITCGFFFIIIPV